MNLLATGAAGATVLLFGLGLLSMTAGEYRVGGVCFLLASFLIYLRETRLLNR